MAKDLQDKNLTLFGSALIKTYQIREPYFEYGNLPSHIPHFLVKLDLIYPLYLPDWALCDFRIFQTENLLEKVLYVIT
jgi:hypothetical protein